MRLSQASRKFNISVESIVTYLKNNGEVIEVNPNKKLSIFQIKLLEKGLPTSIDNILKNPLPKKKEDKVKVPILKTEKTTPEVEKNTLKPTSVFKKINLVLPSSATKKKKINKETNSPEPSKEKTDIKSVLPLEKDKSELKKQVESKPKKLFHVLGSIKIAPKPSKPTYSSLSSVKTETSHSKVKRTEHTRVPKRPNTAKPFIRYNRTEVKTRRRYRKGKREPGNNKEVLNQETRLLSLMESITVKELSKIINVPFQEIIELAKEVDYIVSVNQILGKEIIELIANNYDRKVKWLKIDERSNILDNSQEKKVVRAPIISVMGHVDHGKTSLLDYIRKSNVIKQEFGGITQSIGAYEAYTKEKQRLIFLDTPGHKAFTKMRARGAELTDLSIIIIAADDGIKPQTKEAISHAKKSGIPIVIAINKIDYSTADSNRVKQQLADLDILVEELGGNYQCQEISAKTGKGVQELLDKVLMEVELLNLKANPDTPASCSVIEASLEQGRGYMVYAIVEEGTLKIGDNIISGEFFGKVKALFDFQGKKISKALPSTPIQILGLDGAPSSGEKVKVVSSDKEARKLIEQYKNLQKEQSSIAKTSKKLTFDQLFEKDTKSEEKEVNIIIKANKGGILEALESSLLEISAPKVKVNIIGQSVGTILESDIILAKSLNAFILGLQTKISSATKKIAIREKVEISLHKLIHDAVDEVIAKIKQYDSPKTTEVLEGKGHIIQTFDVTNVGRIAGCHVDSGIIKKNSKVRFIRDGKILHEGPIIRLELEKKTVKEVRMGINCAILVNGFNDIQVDDRVEAFVLQEV